MPFPNLATLLDSLKDFVTISNTEAQIITVYLPQKIGVAGYNRVLDVKMSYC